MFADSGRVAPEIAMPTEMKMEGSGSATPLSASSSSSPAKIMSQFREGKSRSTRALVEAKNLFLGGQGSVATQLRRENDIKERRSQLWAEFRKFSRSVNHPEMRGWETRDPCACSLLRSAILVENISTGVCFPSLQGVAQCNCQCLSPVFPLTLNRESNSSTITSSTSSSNSTST